MGMTDVTLTGQLVCANAEEATRVRAALTAHVAATRAEPGCISFDVMPTDDPLVWQVDERFATPADFDAHQARAGASPWAAETKGIRREYVVKGMP